MGASGQRYILASQSGGSFSLGFFAPVSQVEVGVEPPWTLVSPKTVSLQKGGKVELLVDSPYCALGGKVQLPGGAPVSNVTLQVQGTGYRTRSLEDGRFHIQLPDLRTDPGDDVKLEIISGWRSELYALEDPDRAYPPHNPRSIVTVRRIRQGELVFRVLRSDGEGLEKLSYVMGDRRWLLGGSALFQSCKVSEDGLVRLRVSAGSRGSIRFVGEAKAYKGESELLNYTVPQATETVYLTRTRKQRVLVIDANGKPVSGAQIEALTAYPGSENVVDWTSMALGYRDWSLVSGRSPTRPIRLSSAVTDTSGLAIMDYGARSDCVLRGAAPGFMLTIKRIDVRLPGPQRFVLERGASVAGVIENAGALPALAKSYSAENLGVVLRHTSDRPLPERRVEIKDGRFEIRGITPGNWRLWLCGKTGFRGIKGWRVLGPKLGDLELGANREHRIQVKVLPRRAGSVDGLLSHGPIEGDGSLRLGCLSTDPEAASRRPNLVHVAPSKKFHFSRLDPGPYAWVAIFRGTGYRSSVLIPGRTTVLPNTKSEVHLRLSSKIVRFRVHARLRESISRTSLFLQGKKKSQWIRIDDLRGVTANVGIDRYELYLGSAKGTPIGSYEITAATRQIVLVK